MRKTILLFVWVLIFFAGCEKVVLNDHSTSALPQITLTDPVNNATGIALNKVISVTFNKAMNPVTLNTTSVTVKQGNVTIPGTVTYSGTTAVFSPSSNLSASLVYTLTITSGVKDLAGNSLASNAVYGFTTGASTGLSFANDVVPVLVACDVCHQHHWTRSTVANTFYTNLLNAGYVKPTTYTTSKIYTIMNGGHPGTSSMSKATTDKVINWMIEGSKNN